MGQINKLKIEIKYLQGTLARKNKEIESLQKKIAEIQKISDARTKLRN